MEETPKVKRPETAMKMAVHAPWPEIPFKATEMDETPSPPAMSSPEIRNTYLRWTGRLTNDHANGKGDSTDFSKQKVTNVVETI